MPEYLGVGIPVGKVESDSGGGPVQLAGNVYLCSAFRIDEFHRGIILLVFRNIWLVFRVVLPVVPFHGRRQGEGAYSVNGLVVRAWTALYGFPWKHKGVRMRTIDTFEMAGFAADFGGNVVSVHRLLEPSVGIVFSTAFLLPQEIEYVEHHGACGPGSGQSRHSLSLCVPGPYPDCIIGRETNRPGVSEPETGARLPRYFLHRIDQMPVDLVRPVHFLQGIDSPPESAFVGEREAMQAVTLPGMGGVGTLVGSRHL